MQHNKFKNIYLRTIIVFVSFLIGILIGPIAEAQDVDATVDSLISKSSRFLENGDTVLAYNIALKAVDLAKDDNGYTRAVASIQLANIMQIRAMKSSEAFDLYLSAYLLLSDVGVEKNKRVKQCITDALIGSGTIYYKFEAWYKALNSFNRIPSDFSPDFHEKYSLTKQMIIECYFNIGQYDDVIKVCNELIGHNINIESSYSFISNSYSEMGDIQKAISNEKILLEIYNDFDDIFNSKLRIAKWYDDINKSHDAIELLQGLLLHDSISENQKLKVNYRLARDYVAIYKYTKAEEIVKRILDNAKSKEYNVIIIKVENLWVNIAFIQKNYNTAYKRLSKYIDDYALVKDDMLRLRLYRTAVNVYEKAGRINDAYIYSKKMNVLNVGILKKISAEQEKTLIMQRKIDSYSNKILGKRVKKEIEKQKAKAIVYKNEKNLALDKNSELISSRRVLFLFSLALVIVLIIVVKLYQKQKRQRKELEVAKEKLEISAKKIEENAKRYRAARDDLAIKNKDLEQKSIVILEKNKKIEESISQIRAMQDQLVESQRLASLGQVTAGIAHEIRNPLNFVNNFSSLIVELLEDVKEIIEEDLKLEGEHYDELNETLELIESNAKKINNHGRRASEIISNMLDVSRKNTDSYVEVDINKLIKDSVDLAYEGVKGSRPGFDVDVNYNFDNQINKIGVVRQDLGRVFINLISNSCDALEHKVKNNNYKAEIDISTQCVGDNVVIKIKDNGSGMSQEVIDNIFTPFFTTKAAGKGTGLGLTMTYDIITKLHKGKLSVESKEGEFTVFTIEIPNNLKS